MDFSNLNKLWVVYINYLDIFIKLNFVTFSRRLSGQFSQ